MNARTFIRNAWRAHKRAAGPAPLTRHGFAVLAVVGAVAGLVGAWWAAPEFIGAGFATVGAALCFDR